MISILQRIQGISRNTNALFSILIIFTVTYLHVMTIPQIDPLLSIDKVVHVVIFYFVGLWFLLIFRNNYSLILMTLLFTYALMMEILQMNLSYRSFDWFDWVADIFGLLLSFFHLSKKL